MKGGIPPPLLATSIVEVNNSEKSVCTVIHTPVGHPLCQKFVSETPYLVQYTAKAPHITGSGVLLLRDGLWGSPANWDHSSMRHIDIFVSQIPRHTKVSNLQWRITGIITCVSCAVKRQTLHSMLETSMFLAAKSLWTNPCRRGSVDPEPPVWRSPAAV